MNHSTFETVTNSFTLQVWWCKQEHCLSSVISFDILQNIWELEAQALTPFSATHLNYAHLFVMPFVTRLMSEFHFGSKLGSWNSEKESVEESRKYRFEPGDEPTVVETGPLATVRANAQKKSWEMMVNPDAKPETTPKIAKRQPTENQNDTKTEI